MTEEIAELQDLVTELDDNFEACFRDCKRRSEEQVKVIDELAGDITRLEKNADTRWENHDKRIEGLEVHTNPIYGMQQTIKKLEGLIEGLTKAAELDTVIKKKHARAIKILDNRIDMLREGHNMHSKIFAQKFPEIPTVSMIEGPNGPEKGPIGPN